MTGGGVYPALAVLQILENKGDHILWIGSQSGMEETLLNHYNLEFKTIPAAGLHGVGLFSLPSNLLQLLRGWLHAKKIVREFNPDVLFFTGGYLGVPVAFAGRNIPSVVFIPDVEPGFALQAIMHFTQKIALVSDQSKPYIQGRDATITGYPIRSDLKKWDCQKGRNYFGIPQNEKVLLVFGGSKGARSINLATFNFLPDILKEMHVIHISGGDNWWQVENFLADRSLPHLERYHAFPFLTADMGAALSAADLVVCRAGASTMGELPYFGLPAILVPYPHAWNYQHQNAEVLARKGGAVILEDSELVAHLYGEIQSLIHDEKRLSNMARAMKEFSDPDAAQKIAKLVLSVNQAAKKEVQND